MSPGGRGARARMWRPVPCGRGRGAPGFRVALVLAAVGLAGAPGRGVGQDQNILLPAPVIEQKMRSEPFEIVQETGSRFEKDRTQRTTVRFADSTLMMVKFAEALPGADTFNNRPRYELAAYEVQKLFLDPGDYVVPPTVARCFPVDWYREHMDPKARRTFRGMDCVLVVMQYWLWNVEVAKPMDEARWRSDTVYARHLSDFNVLTALIRHQDSNLGNYLLSQVTEDPRVFSVDNGVAFSSQPGNRGHRWDHYRLDRIAAGTLARLQRITRADLERTLAVVAQFESSDDGVEPTAPGPSLNPGWGVREGDDMVQLGLTAREIDDVASRLRDLLEKVGKGDVRAF